MAIQNGDDLRVTANMKFEGDDDVKNTFTVRVIENVGSADEQILNGIAVWVEQQYLFIDQHLPSELTFIDIDCYNITQDDPLPPQAWPTLVAGGNLGSPMPPPLCILSRGETGLKRFEGRKYWPGPVQSAYSGITLSAAVLADYQNAAVAWASPYVYQPSGMIFQAVVITTKTGLGAHPTSFIANVTTNSQPDYQRRRKTGRGS